MIKLLTLHIQNNIIVPPIRRNEYEEYQETSQRRN